MSLDGLMTFAGIVLAIIALLDPVQRKSLIVLMRGRCWSYLIGFLVAIALACVSFVTYSGSTQGWGRLSLDLGAFVALIMASIAAWSLWTRALLSSHDSEGIEELLRLSLLENRFGEVERLLKKNRRHLHTFLKAEAIDKLYHQKIVRSLLTSGSSLHLELLAETDFANSMPNVFRHTETLMRELLEEDDSPLRSAVIAEFGGDETRGYDTRDRDLIDRTIGNPTWYMKVRADYGITLAAAEKLRSDELDANYNIPSTTYGTQQGKSGRSTCLIYLAINTHVLALRHSIAVKWNQDFYVSDLADIHESIQERVRAEQWEPLSAPTPYEYLIKDIHYNLRDLSSRSAREHFVRTGDATARLQAPTYVARDLARIWVFCVGRLANSSATLPEDFLRDRIEILLNYILQLRHNSYEIFGRNEEIEPGSLEIWLDLFLRPLKEMLRWHQKGRTVIYDTLTVMDRGKLWMRDVDGFSRELGL